jgi:hypothetical protein
MVFEIVFALFLQKLHVPIVLKPIILSEPEATIPLFPPGRRPYPPACKPYGLEAGPEANYEQSGLNLIYN